MKMGRKLNIIIKFPSFAKWGTRARYGAFSCETFGAARLLYGSRFCRERNRLPDCRGLMCALGLVKLDISSVLGALSLVYIWISFLILFSFSKEKRIGLL